MHIKLLSPAAFLSPKCTKKCTLASGVRAPPGPAGGAYSAPPDPLAELKGPTSKGRGGRGVEKKGEGEGRGRKGRGREKGGGGAYEP